MSDGIQVCSHCGSDDVRVDAYVNPNTDEVSEFDNCICEECGGETKLTLKITWMDIVKKAREQYRNDDIQIDEPADQQKAKDMVVPSEDGYWVQAWVLVGKDDAGHDHS